MAKIKLELHKKDALQKIRFAQDIEKAMTGNTNFPSPDPAIASLTAARTKLINAVRDYNDALSNSQTMYMIQNNNEAELDQVIKQLANYVENKAAGDTAIIQSAAMNIVNGKSPAQIPAQVLITSIKESNVSGQLFLKWKRVENSKTYRIEINTDVNNPAGWLELDTVTQTKYIVSGLISGTKYWFRIQAIGAAGKGPFSDPAVKYAP